ncbi:nicotinate-nucleotide--dimethylbenzimidazole phosphoribosyltransferase [Streptomyces sp. LP11]|uniref:Nicotinate-nucleotide--dimethylbenzimidazole phosphoribosyltransferase n=1 Tax=Streptomyces pyxinicus TaxID=2970331 RepID=A0ABT2B173_9ACTN|nr:nicotinate-nucleotide--dimethylbenzimidazole phosphoribosyltransferase [Streptomyces sp. LP11]MCS0601860.1 nicotinate-nucleotide--dimethylbenzimidazole phosphoribosyltransferase [Streptomyces sp. LP11]
MTDTGQIPGEGQPESAGMVEQPGAPAHSTFTYLSEAPAEDEDLLLPGAQGAWGNEVPPPAPEPVVETVHAPGPHETAGRDSGSVDLSGVRLPGATPASVPPSPILSAPQDPSAAPQPPRRPLHLGPPIPNTSAGPVRSLADRGPAGAPVRQPGPAPAGPEYLDAQPLGEMAPGAAAPWGAVPGAVPSDAPVPAAETVDPGVAPVTEAAVDSSGAAQATLARLVIQAGAQAPAQVVHGHDGVQPAQGHDGVYAPPADGAEPVPVDDPEPVAVHDAAPGAVDTGAGAETQPGAAGAEPAEGAAEPVAAEAPADDVAVQPVEPVTETQPAVAARAGEAVPQPAPEAAPVDEPQAVPVEEARSAPVAPVAEVPPAPAESAEPVVPQAVPAEPLPVAADETPSAQAQPVAAPQPPATVEETAPAAEAEPVPDPADATPAVATEADPETEAPAAVVPEATTPDASAPEEFAYPAQGPQQVTPAAEDAPLPSSVSSQAMPGQSVGQFVPVEGQVPTTPHLAPTPPQPLILPAQDAQHPQPAGPEQPEPVATVPAPREAEPAAAPEAVPHAVDATDAADATEDEVVHDDVVQSADAVVQSADDVVQNADDLRTTAADQDEIPARQARPSHGPAAPGYADAEREAVLKVMRERRDIRNGFRGDPIPHEVLLRVLEAAHTAPSVGHSQPWDFVVIRSAETRRTMHELAMRQREAYAKSLPKGRAKQFKELKIEAILDTPVNIVVTADPTRGGRHTLGRHTQPQMAPYSSALAVENLWLAARAEGLGVGWVSFFDEREMVRALGLPEHLEVVAYLCVGYVDEFPDEPELMQVGWSKRRPLSWVVHEETYGRRALPGEDPHDLLAETVAQIRPLDAKALGEAWERQKRMTKPAGALGMLEIISAQLSGLSRQCPPPIPEPAAVAIFAGDHGVHAQGVTPWPQEVTSQMVANFLGGGAVCNAFAAQVGAEVCVVDVGVAADLPATPGLLPRKIRGGTSDMTTGPAMTREEAKAAIEVGIETARDLVAAGNKALLTGEMGIANTTASAALISVFTGADPADVTGRGTGINDETLARKTEVVRRALELHQPDPADPVGVLAAIGGFEHAAMVGLLLGGASLRTPVILDGVSAGAAALVARAIAPEVLAACIAGHRSAEPGHVAALNKLGLRPLVDLDLRLGEGTGALLALPLVQSTARAMHEVATFDSAGVTEK